MRKRESRELTDEKERRGCLRHWYNECLVYSGISIGCEAGPAPLSGFQDILLSVNRSGSPIIINSTVIQFLYEVSVVNAVVPTWGPIAGGTLVTVTGYYLNIGDTSMTYALVAGQNCTIM